MHLTPTQLVRRARRDEAGAVAVVVALMSVLLFSIGALAIDLGNAYARKRVSQTTADLAALAGAAHLGVDGGVAEARKAAIDYVRSKNPTQSDDGLAVPDCAVTSATAPVCWDNDGNIDNGEITFTDNLGLATRGIGATRIRVITPRREVAFGLGAIMGFSKVSVTKAATAGIFSPGGAEAPPFYLTNTDGGLTCIKDNAPGSPPPSGSAIRSALLAAPPITVGNDPQIDSVSPASPQVEKTSFTLQFSGQHLGGVNKVTFTGTVPGTPAYQIITGVTNTPSSVTVSVPATIPAGSYTVTVSDASATSNRLAYVLTVKPPASPPAALVAIVPTSAPELAATSFTLTGTGFGTNAAQVVVNFGAATATVTAVTPTTITGTTPNTVFAGPVMVQVSVAGVLSSNTLPFTFTASPAPVIAIAPASGPETATNTVVVTGTNLPTTVTTASVTFGNTPVQTITRDPATGSLTVKPPVGTANTTVQVVVYNGSTASNSVPYLYYPDPTTCPGTSSNRGYLDEPRFVSNAQSLELNIQQGIDHNLHSYQTYRLPANQLTERDAPPTGQECKDLAPGTVLQSGPANPIPDINCVRLRTGNISGSLETGYFDKQAGRMYQGETGGVTGNIGGHAGVDEDSLFDSRFVDPANVDAFTTAVLSGAVPSAAQQGWLKDAVLACPRFALLPVTNAPDIPPSGTTYYPIIGFKGLFITSVAADTSADHGFTFTGGSLATVKGIVFDLKWLNANISSSAVIRTQDYVGVGPRIAKLVRDADDGNY